MATLYVFFCLSLSSQPRLTSPPALRPERARGVREGAEEVELWLTNQWQTENCNKHLAEDKQLLLDMSSAGRQKSGPSFFWTCHQL